MTTDTTEQKPKLSELLVKREVDEFTWRALTSSVFPGAKPESILMAVDYCRARKLDILKKPVHLVPMKVDNKQTGQSEWRDVVMPGIAEARLLQRRPGAPPDPGPATPAAAQTSGAAGPSPGVEDERISMKPLVDVATIRMWLAAKASQAGLA